MRTLDYTALTRRVSRQEMAAFALRVKTDKAYPKWSKGLWVTSLVFASLAVFVVTLFWAVMIALPLSGGVGMDNTFGNWFGLSAGLIIIVGVYAATIMGFRSVVRGGFSRITWLRLAEFATANELVFTATGKDPHYPGMLFEKADQISLHDTIRPTGDAVFVYGNMTRITGSGKSRSATEAGYLMIKLERSLPHVVLDAHKNNSILGSGLPAVLAQSQRLSLEGDFDRHFSLYCPTGYETDALYIFTPDLMALLVDEAGTFDVEIVDDRILFYPGTLFELRHAAIHQRLFRIIETVGAKAIHQTDLYRDDRTHDFRANRVAPAGQRLVRSVSVSGVILALFIGTLPLWPLIGQWISPS